MNKVSTIGIVVIGRNEGALLIRCLRSSITQSDFVVYVDSGSSDDSVQVARSLEIDVLELNPSKDFSAARARNEGFSYLLKKHSHLQYVQFVDGDCELFPNWLEIAVNTFVQSENIAVICGVLNERHPEKSIYNRICALEWNGMPGLVDACGGIFTIRANIFSQHNGFNPKIIAGEEPELCFRIRQSGGNILKVSDSMAWHDADITEFKQWWKRMIRSGHSYAQGMAIHGKSAERFCVKETISIWIWGGVLPITFIFLSLAANPWFVSLFAVYLVKAIRIAYNSRTLFNKSSDKWLYSCVCILGKVPEFIGQMKFWINSIRGKHSKIIEYKSPLT